MTSKVKMKKSTGDKKLSKIPIPVWKQPVLYDEYQGLEQVRKESPLPPWYTLTGEHSEGSLENVSKSEKPLSRMDMLMNNELFKKHLSKHADLLKRHTLSLQKFGLRKAMSNIDLSKNSDFEDTARDYQDSSLDSTNESNMEKKSLPNNDTKIKLSSSVCERRQSFSCDQNPSELFSYTTNSTFSHSLSTKRRLYIPSFSEFKRTRPAVSVSCDRFDSLKDDFCFHLLDTITEDEHVKQSKTTHSISEVPSLSTCEKSKTVQCSVVSARSQPNRSKSERSQRTSSGVPETDDSQCYDSQETLDEVFMEENNFSENDTKLQNFPDTRISPVFRSTSDVCTTYSQSLEAQRKRRLRKQRQCKSEPFIRVQSSDVDRLSACSTYERNADLVGSACSLTTTSGNISTATSFLSFGEESEADQCSNCDLTVGVCEKRCSNLSLTSNDSGVVHQCPDHIDADENFDSCLSLHAMNASEDQPSAFCNCLESKLERSSTGSFEDSGIQSRSLCTTCQKLKMTQREIIHEICDIEMNYGRDLNILKDEIYTPLKLAGLLTCEQLDQVFGNLDDLIRNNSFFCKKLRSACCNSENLCNINMGLLFLDSSDMLSAFEKYCLNQHQAITVLDQIVKEKELLKIFLQVSQTENALLRRMHLKSFLMLPVQQIVRYPLILKRLYKVTPFYHQDRENIKIAQTKMEEFLSLINSKVNVSSQPKRKSHFEKTRHRVYSSERHEMQAIALDVVGWNKKEGFDLICSKIWLGQPTDHMWAAKKCKNVKFTQLHAVLLALKKTNGMLERRGSTQERKNSVLERRGSSSTLFPNQSSSVEKAAVVLLREKNGKFQVLREPLALEKCVVTVDPEYDEAFEIQEWGKEAYVIKCDDVQDTKLWIHHLKQQTKDLNQWRKRRNAMPNIMLKKVT